MPIGDIVGKSEVSFSQDGNPRDSWMYHKCCYELRFEGRWERDHSQSSRDSFDYERYSSGVVASGFGGGPMYGYGDVLLLYGDFTEKCWSIGKNQSCAFNTQGPDCASLTGFGGRDGKVCLTVQKTTSLAMLDCDCEKKGELRRVWRENQWDQNGSEEDLQLLIYGAIVDFAECGPHNGCF